MKKFELTLVCRPTGQNADQIDRIEADDIEQLLIQLQLIIISVIRKECGKDDLL